MTNPFARSLDDGSLAGWVAKDNLNDLAARVHELLDGKKFLWVEAYEYAAYQPTTRLDLTAQQISVLPHGVQVSDGSYSWTLTGRRESQPGPGDTDLLRDGMVVAIDRKRMTVELKTPEGKRAWWHVVVTGEDGVRAASPPAQDDMVQILCSESVARRIELVALFPRARLAPPVLFGDDKTPTYVVQPEGTF
jgi:hypothetical protein